MEEYKQEIVATDLSILRKTLLDLSLMAEMKPENFLKATNLIQLVDVCLYNIATIVEDKNRNIALNELRTEVLCDCARNGFLLNITELADALGNKLGVNKTEESED